MGRCIIDKSTGFVRAFLYPKETIHCEMYMGCGEWHVTKSKKEEHTTMKIKKILLAAGLLLGIGAGAVASIGWKETLETHATSSQGDVIANDKARIWIGYDTSNPFYSYADANTGIRLWIHSTSAGGEEHVYGTISGEYDNVAESNRRYDYFDVDLSDYTNEWYMTVQKFQGGSWKAATNPIQLTSSNAFKVYYVNADWSWDQTAGTVSAGAVSSVDAGMAAKALGGMHACSSSAINGYNAFPNFNSTFVKSGETWKTVGELSDYTINDFAYGDTSYSGDANVETNAYEKYEFVKGQYTVNSGVLVTPLSSKTEGSDGVFLAITCVASCVTLTTSILFVCLKKKRFGL